MKPAVQIYAIFVSAVTIILVVFLLSSCTKETSQECRTGLYQQVGLLKSLKLGEVPNHVEIDTTYYVGRIMVHRYTIKECE